MKFLFSKRGFELVIVVILATITANYVAYPCIMSNVGVVKIFGFLLMLSIVVFYMVYLRMRFISDTNDEKD